jgi:hypothetical protein
MPKRDPSITLIEFLGLVALGINALIEVNKWISQQENNQPIYFAFGNIIFFIILFISIICYKVFIKKEEKNKNNNGGGKRK